MNLPRLLRIPSTCRPRESGPRPLVCLMTLFAGMARAAPRRPTLGRYVPTHFSSCSSIKCGSGTGGGSCISKSRWADLNFPQVPTLAAIEGSAGNFAASFPQHDAIFAPTTNGKRRVTSDGRRQIPPVAVPFLSTRPNRKSTSTRRSDRDIRSFTARETNQLPCRRLH